MWSPPNKQALPSQDEIKRARKAIDELESELKVANQVLEQAKLRFASLTQDLAERRAWIAPVRRLPFEVLSEIFTVCSEISHLAPVTITEVCRSWRGIILATPRAWLRIYLNNKEHRTYLNRYLNTFLARGAQKPLHIAFPEKTQDPWSAYIYFWDNEADEKQKAGFERVNAINSATKTLVSVIHRIQCLSLSIDQLIEIEDSSFPNLTRLTLITSPTRSQVTAPFFARSRFPRLQFLDSINCPWKTSAHSTHIHLPPLQQLSMVVDQQLDWVKAIQSCADTLKSLEVHGGFGYKGHERFPIEFPVLESLMIDESTYELDTECIVWPIQAATPALLSYAELLRNMPDAIPHNDVKRVTHLQTTHIPEMSSYPAIRTLQLNTACRCIFDVIEQLLERQSLCPDLQQVELLPTDSITLEEDIRFQKRLEETKKNLGFEILIDGVTTDPSSPFLKSYVSF
jgi:F-box-like